MEVRKYKKKAVIVRALEFSGTNTEAIKAFAKDAAFEVGDKLYVQSKEGARSLSPGDYVIRGVKGEFYSSSPESFLENHIFTAGWLYTKKSRAVTAIQYTGDNFPDIVSFTEFDPERAATDFSADTGECVIPHPSREPYICHPGDYVIRNGDSVYPCAPDIFAKSYVPA